MPDLTLLYYSANALSDVVSNNFRNELLRVVGDTYPIISVTQKPVSFGKNICVGEIGQSYYNLYKQMLAGLEHVETRYVATIEDDTLYTTEHLAHRPTSDDTIAYNRSMYFLDSHEFWTRGGTGTFGMIAPTAVLRSCLKRRYEKFPVEMMPRVYHKYFFMDPGQDDRCGLPNEKTEQFTTEIPLITLCYYGATFGRPKRHNQTSSGCTDLSHWGNAEVLRKKLHS